MRFVIEASLLVAASASALGCGAARVELPPPESPWAFAPRERAQDPQGPVARERPQATAHPTEEVTYRTLSVLVEVLGLGAFALANALDLNGWWTPLATAAVPSLLHLGYQNFRAAGLSYLLHAGTYALGLFAITLPPHTPPEEVLGRILGFELAWGLGLWVDAQFLARLRRPIARWDELPRLRPRTPSPQPSVAP